MEGSVSTLESSAIRHLILKAKLTGKPQSQLQMSDIVRTVVDMAVKQGLLREAPHQYLEPQLEGKISAVIWELIIEGVYTPGLGTQQPNLPFLCVTEHGRKCFEAGELTAHDPDDYLRRLKTACPSIDDTTLLYTERKPSIPFELVNISHRLS